MLVPVSVVVPGPSWLSPPVPELLFESVKLAMLLIASVPLIRISQAPIVPPLSISSVPSRIVVPPE